MTSQTRGPRENEHLVKQIELCMWGLFEANVLQLFSFWEPICLSFFSCHHGKILQQKQFRGEKFSFSSQFKGIVLWNITFAYAAEYDINCVNVLLLFVLYFLNDANTCYICFILTTGRRKDRQGSQAERINRRSNLDSEKKEEKMRDIPGARS